MQDELAIQQVINSYSEGGSRGDWDQVASTFTPDGIWEVLVFSVKFEGRDAIRDAQASFAAPMDYLVQANSPGVITVNGDSATARSVVREHGKFAGKDEALEVLGHYDDKLIRTAEGWKFSHRIFELQGMHRIPLLPAEQK